MERLLEHAERLGLGPWAGELAALIARKQRYIAGVDAKARRYLDTFASLPEGAPASVELASDRVRIGDPGDLDPASRETLRAALGDYRPWRKGPFALFGIELDAEWDSSLKWNRLREHIAPLAGRRVLDIGSSNGYYLFRMAAADPALALGIEPYLTNWFQFRLLQHYARVPQVYGLPVRFEELPDMAGYFDTVFSMGVLYHRRAPLETLAAMRRMLRRGGELVLETLVIPGEGELALCPAERYAKMNNVYFLPSVPCLEIWLRRAGFTAIRCVDVSRTTGAEQRKTEWVNTETLEDFLDPRDPEMTIEGYPAPRRALLIARNPG
ncbi:tRNA U34 carboxymethyltransferase [Desulfuromonas versatilis]|uniref:tRNA U34 carboxymethyltransferase n=1 Tax=Desulfuromonas versatilis TaxID=2802975 RepID=A0ABM8I1E2_9BACT|nr:tRNA 5-methoxyuridine(34)/uridine 5-oxyacetic acid(34) synthase CmoB [Desulfuromonas versatilis]BCR06837.1 tRNA U34 carboxymethyltransferase [Desulfuromonas versatilis]